MRSAGLLTMLLLVAFTAAGCQAIEGIFKAGVWVGVLGVVLLVGIIAFIATKVGSS